MGEEGTIGGPVVFQCAKCLRILGDSLTLVATDEEMKTITLQGTDK